MPNSGERRFRIALTIKDNPTFSGAHAVLALGEEDDKDTPVLVIEAGGFVPDATGAAMLADMLRDAADAIDDHVGKEREHVDTASLPVHRPKFNPKPTGPR